MTKAQKKVLEDIPVAELLAFGRERNEQLKASSGLWAAQKKLMPCPKCGEPKGVREMVRHLRDDNCKPARKARAKGSGVE